MKCSQAKLFISWAKDEPLPEYERARLETHVQVCNPCASYRTRLLEGRELFARAMAAPAENFEWKVQLKIQQALREAAARGLPARERSRFWLPASLTAATTALAVVAIGGLVSREPDSGRRPTGGPAVAGVTRQQSLASVEGDPPSVEQPRDAGGAGANPVSGGGEARPSSDSVARARGTATPGARTRGTPDGWGAGGAAVQRVGYGDPLFQRDTPTSSGGVRMFDASPVPPGLAQRDQLEQELLEAQHRADELRRLLNDFEVGTVTIVPDSATLDTLPAEAPPRR
jgi:hypothetical protein